MLVAAPGLYATCASRAFHFYLSHSSFQAERDADIDAGLHSMPAAVGLVIVCNCHRLGGRGSIVGVQARQLAWTEAIELRAHGEWSAADFKVPLSLLWPFVDS